MALNKNYVSCSWDIRPPCRVTFSSKEIEIARTRRKPRANQKVRWWEHTEVCQFVSRNSPCISIEHTATNEIDSARTIFRYNAIALHEPYEPSSMSQASQQRSLVFSNFCQTRWISMVLLPDPEGLIPLELWIFHSGCFETCSVLRTWRG